MVIDRFYPILDTGLLGARGMTAERFAAAMRAAGVKLLQYRDKAGEPQVVLRNAALIREMFAGAACRLILNDRADLAVLAGWDGVHVGQGDLSPQDARRVVGVDRWVGVSTHTAEEVVALLPASHDRDMGHPDFSGDVDYVAVGPVFSTGTKLDAEPVVGLEGVRRARALTTKPLVAIGGITRENAQSVIEAGADSVSVIGGLFVPGESVEKVARDFLDLFR